MASSIQLLRSTNAQERPFPGNLLEGQPAVNLNASEPGLFFKAADGTLVKFGPAAITSDGLPPNSSPQGSSGNTVGELWLDKSVDPAVLKVYDGTAWVDAGSGGGGGTANFVRWIYTAAGGETSLSGSSGGVLLEYTPGLEEVYVNGVLITRGTDYSAINGSSITNLDPLTAGDVVTVTSMNPLEVVQLPGQVTLLRWTVLATSGQTVFSGVDSSGQQLDYSPGFEEVYVNGAFLRRDIDYTATDGSTITGLSPLTEDDEVTVMAWTPFTIGEEIGNEDVADNAKISSTKLEFLQSGTGALPRSIQSKLREFVSVKDFGAVGDGVTDDTSAIQKAIASSNEILFPKGTYLISSPIQVGTWKRLIGAGRRNGTVIHVASNSINAIEFAPNARTVYISGFTISSPSGGANSAFFANPTSGVAESTIESVDVNNFFYAINAGDLFWNNAVRNCRFNTGVGISIAGTAGTSIKNLFEDVYVDQTARTDSLAISLSAVYSTTFLNCNFGGTTVRGRFVSTSSSCWGISFINCNFEFQKVPQNTGAFQHFDRGRIIYDGCTFWGLITDEGPGPSSLFRVDGNNLNVLIRGCVLQLPGSISKTFSVRNGCSVSVEQSPSLDDPTKYEYLSGTSGYGNLIAIVGSKDRVLETLTYRQSGALIRDVVTQELSTSYSWSATSEEIILCDKTAVPTTSDQAAVAGGTITVSFAGRNTAGARTSGYAEFSFQTDNDGNETIARTVMFSQGSRTVDLNLARSGSNYVLTTTPNLNSISGGTVSVHVRYTKTVNVPGFDIDVSLLK